MLAATLSEEIGRTRQAARDYHDILARCGGAAALRNAFEADMRAERLDYGARMLCNTLRPHFVTQGMADLVARAAGGIVRALHRVGSLALSRSDLQDYVGMTEAEKGLAAIDPRTRSVSALSRMDAFIGPSGLHLVEYNAECPTGVGYNERLFRVFDRLEPMRRFVDGRRVVPTDGTADVLQTLLATWHEWGGRGVPRIAIVDWDHVVTRGEFEIFAEHFRAQGIPTVLVDPRALEMAGGRLVAEGEPVDLVYRRLLTSEFLERRDECGVFEQAYRGQAACFVNNLRTKVLHKKLIFGLLWEPRFQDLLTADEQALVRAHVPWTVAVRPGFLERDGRRHDLAEYVAAHQDDLVLKPNDDYGGRGLVLGAEATLDEWRQALDEALQTADDPTRLRVVQARIPLFQERFPGIDGEEADYYVDLDPFFFEDRMHGFLTRVSRRAISNVTTGGGQIPTYIIQDPEG